MTTRASTNPARTCTPQELLKKVWSILNKLTPDNVEQLMDQVMKLTIDTEEKLKGVVDLVFEKAIDAPEFSEMYGRMCYRLGPVTVQKTQNPMITVTFETLLLHCCQKVIQGDRTEVLVLARKKTTASISERPSAPISEDARLKARRKLIGCVNLIGELFKWNMVSSPLVHNYLTQLLEKGTDDSLQSLCMSLTAIGKDLDVGYSKPLTDQLFSQIKKLVTERKVSHQIHFMLQDVMALRAEFWVPRRAKEELKTMQQIPEEAAMEEQEEQREVNQQLFSMDCRRPTDTFTPPQHERGQAGTAAPEVEPRRTIIPGQDPHFSKQQVDDQLALPPQPQRTWADICKQPASTRNTVKPEPVTPTPDRPAVPKNKTKRKSRFNIDGGRNTKDKKVDDQITLPPQSQTTSTEASTASGHSSDEIKPEPVTPTPDRPAVPEDETKKVTVKPDDVCNTKDDKQQVDDQLALPPQPQRTWADICKQPASTRNTVKPEPVNPTPDRPAVPKNKTKRKSRFNIDGGRNTKDKKVDDQITLPPQSQTTSTEASTASGHSSDEVKPEPVTPTPDRPAVPEDETKKVTVKPDDICNTKDDKQQVDDQLALPPQPQRTWADICKQPASTRNTVKPEPVTPTPDRPAVPKNKTKRKSRFNIDGGRNTKDKKVDDQITLPPQSQTTSTEASTASGHSSDEVKPEPVTPTPDRPAVPEDETKKVTVKLDDVCNTKDDKKLQVVQPDSSAPRDAPSQTLACPEEHIQQLESLLQKDKASNQQIFNWIEENVDEPQQSSSSFLRALVTAVCKVTLKGGKPICPLDTIIFKERIPLLMKYLKSDVGKQLQALYALQALNDSLGQPPRLLQVFFDFFYNFDLISSEGFKMWQKSRDPAEQQGRDVALKAVAPFFSFLWGCGGAMETMI